MLRLHEIAPEIKIPKITKQQEDAIRWLYVNYPPNNDRFSFRIHNGVLQELNLQHRRPRPWRETSLTVANIVRQEQEYPPFDPKWLINYLVECT